MRNKKIKKEKGPSVFGFVIKTAVALGMVLFLILIAGIILETISEKNGMKDATWKMDYMDSLFYDHKYTEIRTELELYELDGEEFDIYWEIVNGYADYMDYLQWARTTEDMVEGSSQKAAEYQQKVIRNAESCRFERNQKQLNAWKEAL